MQDVEGQPTSVKHSAHGSNVFTRTIRAVAFDSSLDMQCTNAMPGYAVMCGVLSHKGSLRQVIYSAALLSKVVLGLWQLLSVQTSTSEINSGRISYSAVIAIR